MRWLTLESVLLSLLAIVAAAIVLLLPTVASRVVAWTHATTDSIRRWPLRTAVAVGLCWVVWLGYASLRDDRPAVPRSHDERSYLLQARLFASGHLSLPTPEHPEFFDTFHVLVRPVYASRYPPGTALVHAPALAVGLPWIATSFAIAFVSMAAFVYAGVRIAGPWAVPVIVSSAFTSGQFMTHSLEAMSQPVLTAATAIVWAVLATRRTSPLAFAIAGAATGLAVLARPLDAVALLTPPVLWMLTRTIRRPHGVRRAAIGVGCAAAAFAPSFAFMLGVNHAVTGSWRQTPWELYAEQSQPGERIGFSNPVPGRLADDTPAQKRALYDRHVWPTLSVHAEMSAFRLWLSPYGRGEVAMTVVAGPTLIAIVALPLAVFGVVRRRLIALAATVVLSIGLYTAVAFGGSIYYMPLAPIVCIAAAAGLDGIVRTRPRLAAGTMLTLALLVAIAQVPSEANALSRTTVRPFVEVDRIEREVVPTLRRPSVIFFRYRDSDRVSLHNEPVYNLETADPLAGPVVRAHWLGARNRVLLETLRDRGRGNDRVYVYDRVPRQLNELGTVNGVLGTPVGGP